MDYIKFPNNKHRGGSALILVVVLTALLAAIGTVFVLSSRVESMSTSGIAEEKALKAAIDSIVEKISSELANDVPGVNGEEYYDYPGEEDKWLASIEPYLNVNYDSNAPGFNSDTESKYIWPQISDLTGILQDQRDSERKFAVRHVKVDPFGSSNDVMEYPEIKLINGSWLDCGEKDDGLSEDEYRGQLADADGDGIADSKWIKLTDISSSKGKDFYAAIRIIDNGGMINVNTAYNFDVTSTAAKEVDGTTQANIDLDQLAYVTASTFDTIDELNLERNNNFNKNVYVESYRDNVLRRIESPADFDYQPFDMSDEIDLRSRFCVSSKYKGRLKTVWDNTLDEGMRHKTITGLSDNGIEDWEKEVCLKEPAFQRYDRRHLLTCWNMDRIINPEGDSMFGVNGKLAFDQNYYTDVRNRQKLFDAIKKALASTKILTNNDDISIRAAQIMVNIIDYVDKDLHMTGANVQELDSTVTVPKVVSGYEGPCVYISEIAQRFHVIPAPEQHFKSYAIELCNPYASVEETMENPDNDQWFLRINSIDLPIINWTGAKKFHVLYNEDVLNMISGVISSNASTQSYPMSFGEGDVISLVRRNPSTGYEAIVDSMAIPTKIGTWFTEDNIVHSLERNIKLHHCIKKLWEPAPDDTSAPTLGEDNIYDEVAVSGTDYEQKIQAHPANSELSCIGDIGNIFAAEAYQIKYNDFEDTIRINLANPIYQNLFQYLTVFDPNNDNIDNDGDGYVDDVDEDGAELKIAGRININTAPWFVLGRLPWVSKERGGAINYELAKAITSYRDKIAIDVVDYSGNQGRFDKINVISGMPSIVSTDIREEVGFASIGELNFVVDNPTADNLYSIWQYGLDDTGLDNYPDVIKIDTDNDGVVDNIDGVEDDFEERDVIFARMSNLVTVRSDVFTAYILVRVGVDGPQQRAIAVLDRSDVYPDKSSPDRRYKGRVKIKALQMVPDIR